MWNRIAAIVPWNTPGAAQAHEVAPALLAGCCVVVKISPEAFTAAYHLAEACEKAGLPTGVVNVATASREVSESLLRNPGVHMVTFTGSTVTGKRMSVAKGEVWTAWRPISNARLCCSTLSSAS